MGGGRILVQYPAKGIVEIGHIVAQANRIFEKCLNAHCPKLMHIGESVAAQIALPLRNYIRKYAARFAAEFFIIQPEMHIGIVLRKEIVVQ